MHDKAGEHMGSTNIWMVRAQTDFSDHLLLYPQLGMLWVFSKDGAVSSDTRALVTPLHHICLAVPSKAMTLTQEPPVAIGFSVSIKPTKQAGILHWLLCRSFSKEGSILKSFAFCDRGLW